MNTKAVRNVRKLERPRPLKLSTDGSLRSPNSPTPADSSVFKKINTDNILQDLESLHISINNGNFDESTVSTIIKVCNQLKSKGYELEITFKEQVDRYFVTLRNASREDRLDMASRLRLLEVIELKAMGWKSNENLGNYYTKKLMDLENTDKISSTPSATTSTYFQPQTQHTVTNVGIALAPGEILRSSGKFAKPTKIAGKNYFKDEIVIRNSDSGKVMGIKGRRVHMIEELSDTIISFQRVNPGARDRLVQITGPTEEAIGHAKLLIEDTIRRNASPIREKVEQADMEDEGSESSASLSSLCEDSEVQSFSMKKQLAHSFSMSDASIGEYCFNVQVGQDNIRVLGAKLDLVKTARLVLEEYFAGQAELLEKEKHYEVLVAPTLDSATSCSSSSIHSNSITRLESSKQTSQKTFGIPSSSWLCNGKRERSGNSPNSSSEEETYKAGEVDSSNGESCIRDIPDLPRDPSSKRPGSDPVQFSGYHYETLLCPVPCTSEIVPSSPEASSLNILKQTFLPSYPVKEPEQAKISPMLQGLSSNTQNSQFLKLCDTSEESNVSALSPMSFTPGTSRITYNREFLLTCARSPYSYRQPKDFLQIVKNIPVIQREKSSPESSATESKDIAESSAENQKGES